MRDAAMAEELLRWYDAHARALPWRVPPGRSDRPDPYRIWLSEVMLQQTTVAAVKAYFERFTARWPTVMDLAAAEDADVMAEWAGLGYYARARNLLKCARVVAQDHGGQFPDTKEALLRLPGIGPYTASAITAIAFGRPEAVLDGNVERVLARIYDVQTPLPKAKPELMALAETLTPGARPGDYAQAVMDLGATICTPKSPACGICPWREPCVARARGTAKDLPRKVKKAPKPTRRGHIYVARRRDGAWLLETRPKSGLLGGMQGWPGSDWGDAPAPAAPLDADWQKIDAEVRHTFTHFHLILTVHVAWVELGAAAEFTPHGEFTPTGLPTVMRKVFDVARHSLEDANLGPEMGGSMNARAVL